MPTVTRQSSKPATTRNGIPSGGLLAQAVPVEDMKEEPIKMVLYGTNRTGKTSIACQFPKPLLLVSFEPGTTGGSKSVKKIDGVHFIRVQSKGQAVQLADELKSDTVYKTHVLDTCTSLQDVILAELMGLEEVPVQMNWGTVPEGYYAERSEQAKEVMRKFRNLPAHTILVAQEKDHNPPKEGLRSNKLTRGLTMESFFAADLGAATVKWMHDACDYIGRLYIVKEVKAVKTKTKFQGKETEQVEEVETGRFVRRLLTMLHPNFAAGIRSETPEAVPEYIEADSPQLMYARLMSVIRGERLKEGAHYPPPAL